MLPLEEGGVLGLLRMPDVSELLAPELEFMPLDPELERWRARQSLSAWPLRPVQEVVDEPELARSRSRQVCSWVPVIPWQALGMVLEAPEELLFGPMVEDDPEPMEPEPMLDPPGVAPLEPPMLPVLCAQANCASARAETAHALTSIREVVPICTLLLCQLTV